MTASSRAQAFPRAEMRLQRWFAAVSQSAAEPRVWLAWGALRLYGVLALHGMAPYRRVFRSDGDLREYWLWAHSFWQGQIPYRDFHLLYPPGVLPVLALPPVSLSWYSAEFLLAALVVDALILRLLLRSGRRTGAFVWVFAAPLLGPIFWSRLDIFVAGLLVAGVLSFQRGNHRWAAICLAWAALIKLWPAVFLVIILRLVPRGRRTAYLATAGATLAVGLLPFVCFGASNSLWYIIQVQTGRGVEVESIFAVPLYALAAAGHLVPITISGSVEFLGGIDSVISAISSYLLIIGALYCLWRAIRRPLPGHDAARWLLLVVIVLLLTDRVLSAQYMVWIAAAVALFIDQAANRKQIFTITTLLLVATQLQFPFGFYQMLFGTRLALPLSILHAVSLVFFAAIIFQSINRPISLGSLVPYRTGLSLHEEKTIVAARGSSQYVPSARRLTRTTRITTEGRLC